MQSQVYLSMIQPMSVKMQASKRILEMPLLQEELIVVLV